MDKLQVIAVARAASSGPEEAIGIETLQQGRIVQFIEDHDVVQNQKVKLRGHPPPTLHTYLARKGLLIGPAEPADILLSIDEVGDIPHPRQRLFLSELAQQTSCEGKLVVATPLERSTRDALPALLTLLSTELVVDLVELAYHGWTEKLLNVGYIIELYARGESPKKTGSYTARAFHRLCSWPPLRYLFSLMQCATRPLCRGLGSSGRLIRILESISHFLAPGQPPTHVVTLCSKKKVGEALKAKDQILKAATFPS